MIEGKISQANGRLKIAKVGVSIILKGDRLYLQATFPPKQNSTKTKPHQQKLSLGVNANVAGLSFAESEARKIGALLDLNQFSWEPFAAGKTCMQRILKDYNGQSLCKD